MMGHMNGSHAHYILTTCEHMAACIWKNKRLQRFIPLVPGDSGKKTLRKAEETQQASVWPPPLPLSPAGPPKWKRSIASGAQPLLLRSRSVLQAAQPLSSENKSLSQKLMRKCPLVGVTADHLGKARDFREGGCSRESVRCRDWRGGKPPTSTLR